MHLHPPERPWYRFRVRLRDRADVFDNLAPLLLASHGLEPRLKMLRNMFFLVSMVMRPR